MTRKAALYQAIQILKANDEHKEMVQHLQGILDDFHKCMWDDKTAREAIDKFIKENGRNPTCTDFGKKNGLPPHTSMKRIYGINLSEWLEQNYPTNRPTYDELTKKYTKEFIEEYYRIKPRSQEEFDKKRKDGVKNARSIMLRNKQNCWRSLIKHLDLPFYFIMAKDRTPLSFDMGIHTDMGIENII